MLNERRFVRPPPKIRRNKEGNYDLLERQKVLIFLNLRRFFLTRTPILLTYVGPSAGLRDPQCPSLARRRSPVDNSERRHLRRYNLRTPLRFRAIGLASDKSEHF